MVIFIFWIVFIPLEQIPLESHKKVKIKIWKWKFLQYFDVLWRCFMPYECNQYQKSDKAPFIIYSDIECLIEKIDGWKNNPENSSTTKVGKHIPSVFSLSSISSF